MRQSYFAMGLVLRSPDVVIKGRYNRKCQQILPFISSEIAGFFTSLICMLYRSSSVLFYYQSQASHDIDIASCSSSVHSSLSFRQQQLLIWITSLNCKKQTPKQLPKMTKKLFYNKPNYFLTEKNFNFRIGTVPGSGPSGRPSI